MELPNVTAEDVKNLIPGSSDIGAPIAGGQKIVYPCKLDGKNYAAKFILAADASGPTEAIERIAEIKGRAQREVTIMRSCASPHIVSIGPQPLQLVQLREQQVLFFLEDFIDGIGLSDQIAGGKILPTEDAIRLGKHVSMAIEVLWSTEKVHRDLKPDNIRRRPNGDYVVLDVGMALDLMDDKTWTRPGFIVGTRGYFSPEQILMLAKKRSLDFRSDLFTLGTILYLCTTGRHPFLSVSRRAGEDIDTTVCRAIIELMPPPPKTIRSSTPAGLSEIIMRLLSKNPSQRFRTCAQFRDHLSAIVEEK